MVEFDKEISVEKARALLQTAPGVKLVDDPEHQKYPMPLDTTCLLYTSTHLLGMGCFLCDIQFSSKCIYSIFDIQSF